jgi:hypothetical protein
MTMLLLASAGLSMNEASHNSGWVGRPGWGLVTKILLFPGCPFLSPWKLFLFVIVTVWPRDIKAEPALKNRKKTIGFWFKT